MTPTEAERWLVRLAAQPEIERAEPAVLGFSLWTRSTPGSSATGTGAMEAAVTNIFSKCDKVITVNGGKFGERWAEICESYGIKTHRWNLAWGKAVDVEGTLRLSALQAWVAGLTASIVALESLLRILGFLRA